MHIQKCRLFWYDISCDEKQQLQNSNNMYNKRRSRNVFVHLTICQEACESLVNDR